MTINNTQVKLCLSIAEPTKVKGSAQLFYFCHFNEEMPPSRVPFPAMYSCPLAVRCPEAFLLKGEASESPR